jgi:hypothetical protein
VTNIVRNLSGKSSAAKIEQQNLSQKISKTAYLEFIECQMEKFK